MASEAPNQLSHDDVDNHFMQFAIVQANLCTPTPSAYSVGALLIQHTNTTPSTLPHTAPLTERIGEQYRVVATGYSRELGEKTHAEEVVLLKYNKLKTPSDSIDSTAIPHAFPPLAGRFILYTTMEPCSERLSGRTACTTHCLVSHVQRVVVGVEEPKVFIGNCQGMKLLAEAGVEVRRLAGLEEQCLAMNQHLLAK